ncbi:MAG: hypothetical protein JNM57_14005 [Cyclobacteriaceae bacterium]|nr:hypothetical protein [Cyclobacteriaceae bacterium]
MKKTLSIFAALMILSVAVVARSADKPVHPTSTTGMAVVQSGTIVKLFYKSEKPAKVRVTIYDRHNTIVLTENIKKLDGFMRPYNFSSLPEGDYTIEVADENGKQIEKIDYHHASFKKLGHLVKIQDTEKYMLMLANRGEDVVDIKVLDGKRNLAYQGTEKISNDFSKVFDLTNLKGDFSLEITDKSGTTLVLTYQ